MLAIPRVPADNAAEFMLICELEADHATVRGYD